MKKIIRPFFFTAIAVMLFSCGKKKNNTVASIFAAETISVKTMPVERMEVNAEINSTGLLTTVNEARYSFKIGGVIESITVNEGQFFRKGQLLATLKITEIDAQLQQASLGYEKAKRDFSRTTNLYRDSVATLEQLQNVKTGLDIAQKSVDAVLFNKKYAYIYAIADGFVTKKIANEGEVVNGGMAVLAINETSGASDWVLKVGVTDKEWAAIETGSKGTVTMDAFPGKTIAATVFRKSQAADMGSGSFQVELKMVLGNIKPAIGMFGKATIYTGNKASLPSIPYDAILEADGSNAFVFVPAGNSSVKKVPVLIESFNNKSVIIKSGLENVTDIIISNSAFLNEKSTIKIIK
jgi:RND family efflux transporter MFP subunit